MKNLILIALFASLFLTSCEESASSFSYEKKIVVTGMIESGRTVDTVHLMYTGEVDKKYDPAAYAITNAVVRIIGVDIIFDDTLVHDPEIPGRYFSAKPLNIIQATKTYRLEIRMPDGKSVSSITTVPDTFSMIYTTLKHNDTMRYNSGSPVNFFAWTPSRFHGSYLPTIWSVDSNAARIPKSFIRDTVNNPAPEKLGYRIGLPKEQTYTELPWIVLGYFGKTQFDVYAIDDNYTSFLNKAAAAQGGELREVRYTIQGGLGIFGARTKAKGGITVYISP